MRKLGSHRLQQTSVVNGVKDLGAGLGQRNGSRHFTLLARGLNRLYSRAVNGAPVMQISSHVTDDSNRRHSQTVEHKTKLLDQVRQAIRARHYSKRTENTYGEWIKRFIFFHGKRHPLEMGEPEINQFLTDLAVNKKVSASTQNQALSAILFGRPEETSRVDQPRCARQETKAAAGRVDPRGSQSDYRLDGGCSQADSNSFVRRRASPQ